MAATRFYRVTHGVLISAHFGKKLQAHHDFSVNFALPGNIWFPFLHTKAGFPPRRHFFAPQNPAVEKKSTFRCFEIKLFGHERFFSETTFQVSWFTPAGLKITRNLSNDHIPTLWVDDTQHPRRHPDVPPCGTYGCEGHSPMEVTSRFWKYEICVTLKH